jgi:uncharacterized protein
MNQTAAGAVFLLLVGATGLLGGPAWGQDYSDHGNPLIRLTVKGVPVLAEVVSTPEKLYLGLSHRQELPEGRGMLFLMGSTARHTFCMRDMRCAIDIIWIADGKVTGLHPGLSPDDTGSFQAPAPVPLVLEVPAGFARRHGIKVGDPVVVPKSVFTR